ncbi:MAG: Succinate dehydrogenase cytochrome b558 subunit [Chlamydiae bacterium]|nr:Succinate dehydrogenase cytochrome b558 subunit [Chlamydiota bacterium]
MTESIISKEFFWRRIHSLAGLWLILFIIEHLLTNSQSALFFGDDGHGFIDSVNWIHDLPYLPVIELAVLGIPFLIHGLWGIKYARESRINSTRTDGAQPDLSRYRNNRAFTWQRVTSWLLIVGVIGHVVQMRFMDYPSESQLGSEQFYVVRITDDSGLPTLAERLDFKIYNSQDIATYMKEIERQPVQAGPLVEQKFHQQEQWLEFLTSKPLKGNQVMAVAKDFGTASLLTVRDTFKMPLMIILYTLFVIAAGYHAFNGLWTAFITWGVNITEKTQKRFKNVTNVLMLLVIFLGLASVWLTYINLRN